MPSQSNEATDLPLNQQLHARYPYLSNDPIPTERITSSDYFEEEREAIFARSWLQVAMTSDLDRKSVVSGKSVSVRVDLGGRRIIKQNKHNADQTDTYTRHSTHVTLRHDPTQ